MLLVVSCGRCGVLCDDSRDGDAIHFTVGLLAGRWTGWSLVGAEVWCPRCVPAGRPAGMEVSR